MEIKAIVGAGKREDVSRCMYSTVYSEMVMVEVLHGGVSYLTLGTFKVLYQEMLPRHG